MIIFGVTLASFCIGTVFLMTASVADPDLYFKITDPMVAYTGRKLEEVSELVVKAQNAVVQSIQRTDQYISQKVEETKEKAQEKREEMKEDFVSFLESFEPEPEPVPEEPQPEPQDLSSQALSEAMYGMSQGPADYSVTHFEVDGFTEQEFITGGTKRLVYFNQTDERWGNYGRDSISGYGCGPTAMAMIVSTLREDVYYTPQEMADIFVEDGFWAYGSGTYYNFADGSGERFGLTVEYLPAETTTAETLMQHLWTGKLAIALVGPGHFTNGGHYIVLHGATLTGDVLVADPASRMRSLSVWDPQLILDELSASRAHGAPLWLFSLDKELYLEEDLMFSVDESDLVE